MNTTLLPRRLLIINANLFQAKTNLFYFKILKSKLRLDLFWLVKNGSGLVIGLKAFSKIGTQIAI